MSDQPKWMPDDEQLRGDVFHAFSMEECRKSDPMAVMRDTIRSAVEKALAEQEARHREDLRVITEATRMAADKRAERHKRELIEAKIEVLDCARKRTEDPEQIWWMLDDLRAELAALDKEGS